MTCHNLLLLFFIYIPRIFLALSFFLDNMVLKLKLVLFFFPGSILDSHVLDLAQNQKHVAIPVHVLEHLVNTVSVTVTSNDYC